jgi:hypothetical protein
MTPMFRKPQPLPDSHPRNPAAQHRSSACTDDVGQSHYGRTCIYSTPPATEYRSRTSVIFNCSSEALQAAVCWDARKRCRRNAADEVRREITSRTERLKASCFIYSTSVGILSPSLRAPLRISSVMAAPTFSAGCSYLELDLIGEDHATGAARRHLTSLTHDSHGATRAYLLRPAQLC